MKHTLKTYDYYRDSGIEYLGVIPNHWELRRLKSLGKVRYGLGRPPKEKIDGLPIIRATNVSRGKVIEEKLLFVDPEDIPLERKPILKTGDIIVVRSGAYTGDSAIIPERYNGAVTGYDMVFTPNRVLPDFISYSILSDYIYKDQLILTSLRAAQPHLNKEELNSIKAIVPPLKEQIQIAQYLDAKTSAIDQKIELLKKKIKYYKDYKKSLINDTVNRGLDKTVSLKESGIDWIGEIPDGWKLLRIKDFATVFSGNSISDKSIYEDRIDSFPYISTKDLDIVTQSIDFENGIYIPKENLGFRITKANTSLICLEGANAGKKMAFTDRKVAFVNKLCAIKSNRTEILDKYIFYQLQSDSFSNQFFEILSGMIGGVSMSLLKRFHLLIPSKNEQKEIVSFLDKKVKINHKIIENIQQQIYFLEELRKTLINDVVTGKVRVAQTEE